MFLVRPLRHLLFTILLLLLVGCSIYKSPDRKDLEATVTGLSALHCSDQSLRPYSSESKIIYTTNSASNGTLEFLWEYRIDNQTVIESDNLEGVFCLYEIN